jgi:hypothetical protein
MLNKYKNKLGFWDWVVVAIMATFVCYFSFTTFSGCAAARNHIVEHCLRDVDYKEAIEFYERCLYNHTNMQEFDCMRRAAELFCAHAPIDDRKKPNFLKPNK